MPELIYTISVGMYRLMCSHDVSINKKYQQLCPLLFSKTAKICTKAQFFPQFSSNLSWWVKQLIIGIKHTSSVFIT